MSTPEKLEEVILNQEDFKSNLDDFLDLDSLKDRVIYLFEEINPFVSKRIIQQIFYLKKLKKQKISIYANTTGGSVTDALAIIDVIEFVKKDMDVEIIAMGDCCSAGADILTFATKGMRFATKNSCIMFHPISYELPHDYAGKQEKYAEYMKSQRSLIDKLVAKNIGKKEKEWTAKVEDGLWLTAEEALKLKIIDKIL